VPLEGVTGPLERLAADPAERRLYIAAPEAGTVQVLDLDAGRRVAEIGPLQEPRGVCVIPEARRVVVTTAGDGRCRIYNESLESIGEIDGLEGADRIAYDPHSRRVYVGFARGLAVIDPQRAAKVGEIALEGAPGAFELESRGRRIFVNLPSLSRVAVVDRERRAVVATWKPAEARENSALALDESNGRLFVGCREPAAVVVLETRTGQPVASAACCPDVNDIAYDPPTRRLYASGAGGCVSVIEQMGADRYAMLAQARTVRGAGTGWLLAPATGRLYVAVPAFGEQSAELRVYESPAEPAPLWPARR
jgi:DNA-binding beta-propeller fold protein YncE